MDVNRARHHHHREHLRGFGYFRGLGPGIVTGASDDDPSGIGTYSQAGAAFGFALLWTAVFTLPLAVAVQETSARLGLVSGKGLAALIKERFPRWVLLGAVVLVAIANTFNIGADLGSMAAALHLLVPVPIGLLLIVITALMLGLELFIPYHRYARVLRWLCLSLGAYLIVLFMINVDWATVAKDTLLPTIHWSKPYLAALIAIFGTTISPYLFFWQASEEVEEEIEHDEVGLEVDDAHVALMRRDTLAGMFSAVAVMFAIMVASGATLHVQGITKVETAAQAAEALKPLAGNVAGLLFALGIVGVGALAVPVLAGSTGYALSEAFGWREGLGRKVRKAPGFYLAILLAMVVGLIGNFLGINPIRSLYFAALLNGVTAPPLILLMLILANSRRVLGERTSGRASNVFVGLALILMTALPLLYLVV